MPLRLILNKYRTLAVVLLAVVILLILPSKVHAQCSLLSIIWGGDCVSSLNGGITERTELRQDHRTERTEIREVNETERVEIQEREATERVRLEQNGMTDRTVSNNNADTDQMREFVQMQEFLAQQQTIQTMADSLVQKHAIDTSAQIAQLQAEQEQIARDQELRNMMAWMNLIKNVGAVLAVVAVISYMLLNNAKRQEKRRQRELGEPSYWVVDKEPTAIQRREWNHNEL